MAELNCTAIKNTAGTLKLYYRYSETSGTVLTDSSGNANSGTASRTNILNNSGGKFGYGGVFVAASSDVITLGTTSDIKPTGAFTVGAWVKNVSNGTAMGIFQVDSQNPNEAGFRCEISDAGVLNFNMGQNTGISGTHVQSANSTGTVNNGSWNLVGFTSDGTTMRNWINGTIDGTTTITSGFVLAYDTTTYARVGAINFTGTDVRFYGGTIDDTFLFNGTALGSTQWTKLYSGYCDGGVIGCDL